jgi:hypothetical protein
MTAWEPSTTYLLKLKRMEQIVNDKIPETLIVNGKIPGIPDYIGETDPEAEEHPGLWKGRMGKIILFKTLHVFTAEEKWNILAEGSLDALSAEIESMDDMSFDKGLAGIGWGIEWLSQVGYLKTNTDHFLEDFDDTLYKFVLFAPDRNLSLKEGTLGKIAYFLKRYESRNPSTHRYKRICHQECLVVLSDEIKDKIDGIIKNAEGSPAAWADPVGDIADSLIFLSRFWRHKVNVVTVEETIYSIMAYAAKLLTLATQLDTSIPSAQKDASNPTGQNHESNPATQNDTSILATQNDSTNPASQNHASLLATQNDSTNPTTQNDGTYPTTQNHTSTLSDPALQISLLKLAYACHYAGIKLHCAHWSRQGLEKFNELAGAWIQNMDAHHKTEIIPIFSRLHAQTQRKEYLQELLSGIKAIESSGHSRDLRLGWPKLLFSSLSHIDPGLMSWDEAFLYS